MHVPDFAYLLSGHYTIEQEKYKTTNVSYCSKSTNVIFVIISLFYCDLNRPPTEMLGDKKHVTIINVSLQYVRNIENCNFKVNERNLKK